MSNPRDRASVVVTAVLHVFNTTPPDTGLLRRQLETLMRDEIVDIEREIAAEREVPDEPLRSARQGQPHDEGFEISRRALIEMQKNGWRGYAYTTKRKRRNIAHRMPVFTGWR